MMNITPRMYRGMPDNVSIPRRTKVSRTFTLRKTLSDRRLDGRERDNLVRKTFLIDPNRFSRPTTAGLQSVKVQAISFRTADVAVRTSIRRVGN